MRRPRGLLCRWQGLIHTLPDAGSGVASAVDSEVPRVVHTEGAVAITGVAATAGPMRLTHPHRGAGAATVTVMATTAVDTTARHPGHTHLEAAGTATTAAMGLLHHVTRTDTEGVATTTGIALQSGVQNGALSGAAASAPPIATGPTPATTTPARKNPRTKTTAVAGTPDWLPRAENAPDPDPQADKLHHDFHDLSNPKVNPVNPSFPSTNPFLFLISDFFFYLHYLRTHQKKCLYAVPPAAT